MTLIGQNTYLIVSISSPHILTAAQQTSKALSCWKHRGFARDLSCPFPTEKPQLWRARNKAGTFIQHHCCLSPYIQLGSAEQNRADMCPHGTAVPRAMAGPCSKCQQFHPAEMTLRFALRRKEWQVLMALQNKTLGWAELMTVQVALQVNLHWEIVLAGDWTVILYHLLQRVD